MKESRRDFVGTSIAFGMLSVTKVIAQPGSRAAVSKKNIGFLVSTKLRDKHDNAFQQALSTQGWDSNKVQYDWQHADDNYNISPNQTLKDLAGQHITKKADLIVSAGGLPTATAVAYAVTTYTPKNPSDPPTPPPFIFLIGRYPTSNSGIDLDAADLYNCSRTYKVGGIDQAIPNQNQANFELLRIKSAGLVTIDTVGLIVNNNNPITPPEMDAWSRLTDATDPGNTTDPSLIYAIANPNDQGITELLDTIKNADPQPTVIVVSSDAYLREVGNVDFDTQLRAADGGNFQGWVCYPYPEYVRKPKANSIYSATTPVLATNNPTYTDAAYYQLGLTAADVLDQQMNNTSPQNAGLKRWNGSGWDPADHNFT
jgi:hypothetical protein